MSASEDDVQAIVGREFPGGEFTVERWMAYLWADATDNDNDAFRYEETAAEQRGDAQFVPPEFGMQIASEGSGADLEDIFAGEGLDVDWESGVFHGEQTFEFHQPLIVGETYSVTGEVSEIDPKSEFDVVTLSYEVTDEEDNPAFETQTRVILMR